MDLETYFKVNFSRYKSVTPSAEKIQQLLSEKDESFANDHIALRTINFKHTCKEVLAEYFLNQGYEIKGQYDFELKKLKAIHLEKENWPKVFISELLSEELSGPVKEIVSKAFSTIPDHIASLPLLNYGRKWDLSHRDYLTVEKESPYAAWCLGLGFMPNHYTVDVNSLKSFESLVALNRFLKDNGFKLNQSGGEIKGSAESLLEQSSTMADRQLVKFLEGEFEIPTCYYEFAKRYQNQDGQVFQGFIAQSADKIFESTNS